MCDLESKSRSLEEPVPILAGCIETGKTADLVVLSQNIVELADRGEPQRIGETQVTMTIFDGKVVIER
jgi:predicted amidohydrolase YtcJ